MKHLKINNIQEFNLTPAIYLKEKETSIIEAKNTLVAHQRVIQKIVAFTNINAP
jgi:hypothetical protein